MNDVLKSLTVEEKAAARSPVCATTRASLWRSGWASFRFNWARSSRSAPCSISSRAREWSCNRERRLWPARSSAVGLFGDDKRQQQETSHAAARFGRPRNVDLTAVAGVRFTDPKLQLQFKDYLANAGEFRSKEKRSVYIDSTTQVTAAHGELHDSNSGVEIQLPPDFSIRARSRCSKAGRSSITRQGKTGRTCSSRWSPAADFVHQPAVRAAVR